MASRSLSRRPWVLLALLLSATALLVTAGAQWEEVEGAVDGGAGNPALAAAATPQPEGVDAAAAANPSTNSVIIIGAGIAGLKAAADLTAKGYNVTILEARDRIGGRIATFTDKSGAPLELGAQWIHGSTNEIVTLAKTKNWARVNAGKDSGSEYEALTPTTASEIGAEWSSWSETLFTPFETYYADQQDTAEDTDTLQDAINRFKALQNLTPRQRTGLDALIDAELVQEYAEDPKGLSLNFFDDDTDIKGTDSIITGGYRLVTDYLKKQFDATKKGRLVLSAPVTAVTYGSSGVTVTAGGKQYAARFAVVSVPLGVLKANKIAFTPALPASKTEAISCLGMGVLNKVILQFPASATWDNVNWIARVPLAADGNRWREFFSLRKATGRPIIVAFNAGDAARYPKNETDAALVSQAVAALRGLFGEEDIPDPVATWVSRWHDDPWSLGSYSVVRPGADGTERAVLALTVANRVFFAGEATRTDSPATVQGAWRSGEDAAKAITKTVNKLRRAARRAGPGA